MLAGADADHIRNFRNKYLSVSQLSGLGRLLDDVDHSRGALVCHQDFQLGLGNEIHCVFTAAINFSMPALTAKAFDLRDRHAQDAGFAQRLVNFLKLMRLNDGFDFFHIGYLRNIVKAKFIG